MVLYYDVNFILCNIKCVFLYSLVCFIVIGYNKLKKKLEYIQNKKYNERNKIKVSSNIIKCINDNIVNKLFII